MVKAEREQLEFLRVTTISDGIFAIALTLLVLTIKLPAPDAHHSLGSKLSSENGEIVAYVLSFAVIARYWMFHHRLFAFLARADGRFIAANFVFLALIAFVPFPTELLGSYGGHTVTVVFYAVTLGTVSLTAVGLLHLAHRRGLYLAPESFAFDLRALRPAIVFAISIPIAFLSPTVAAYSWLLLFFHRPAHSLPFPSSVDDGTPPADDGG